jgi:hypothetical protein
MLCERDDVQVIWDELPAIQEHVLPGLSSFRRPFAFAGCQFRKTKGVSSGDETPFLKAIGGNS